MNKLLYIVFGVVLLIFLGLGGYYLYSMDYNFTDVTRMVGKIKPQNPTLTGWTVVRSKITSECKNVIFTDLDSKNVYTGKLLDVLKAGVTYDASAKSFVFTNDVMFNSIDLGTKGGPTCLAAWVGQGDGSGDVAYETASGVMKKLSVTSFPVPATTP